jgi:hypothetical protein
VAAAVARVENLMRRDTQSGRTLIFVGAGLTVFAGMIYLAFELGRLQAGYSSLDQRREQQALQQIIDRQAEEADELQRQLAVLQTSHEIDRETYNQVESSLADLQSRIQEQEEQIAFYEAIVSPDDGNFGLRVQNLAISPADTEGHFELRLLLVQAISQDRAVSGVVRMNIEGMSAGVPAQLDVADLQTDDQSGDIAYSFRYFQGLQREIMLPSNFEPSQINVEIRPQERGAERILHSYDWAAVAS